MFDIGSKNSEWDVTPAQAFEELKQQKNTLLLDVRTEQEYQQARISGSLLVPVQELESQIAKLDEYKSKKILVICHAGHRSLTAQKILQSRGFNQVFNVLGGVTRWHSDGLPLESG